MACTSPLYRIRDVVFEDRKSSCRGLRQVVSRGDYEFYISDYLRFGLRPEHFQQIACGQCLHCRLSYSRSWADRLVLESMDYSEENNWFLTLTYSDDYLPEPVEVLNKETGERQVVYMLDKSELQSFMKRLRITLDRKFGFKNIRFYGCGEYGDKNGRPHFHIILLNCPLPDVLPSDLFRVNREAGTSVLYESDLINRCWLYKGLACLGRLTWHSCAYVARYVMKKQKGFSKDEFLESHFFIREDGSEVSYQDEFVLMSRNPGIAYNYFQSHAGGIYFTDEILVPQGRSVKRSKPPRYFDNKFRELHPFLFEEVRSEREAVAIAQRVLELEQTSLSEVEYLCQKDEIKRSQLLKLNRPI